MMMILQYILTSLGSSSVQGRQRGATMIEYALIIAVVSIALVLAANTVLDGSLSELGTKVTETINGGGDTGGEDTPAN